MSLQSDLLDKNSSIYGDLCAQIASEVRAAQNNLQAKRDVWGSWFKLYLNQMKDATAVSDPLYFTIFNTLMASLYDDKLMTDWKGRREGDNDIAENLNAVYKFDYDAMQLDEADYSWLFNALHYGKGFMIMASFDRKNKLPEIIVPDVSTMMFDPNGSSMQDRFGYNAVRFWGRELLFSQEEIKKNLGNKYLDTDMLQPNNAGGSIFERMQQFRAQANNTAFGSGTMVTGENADVLGAEWWTTFRGSKVMTNYIGKSESITPNNIHIIRAEELKWDYWPVLEREIYPIPGEMFGASVANLTEAHQRMRAKFLNLAMIGAEYRVYGMNLYNAKKIKDDQLNNPTPNKWIGVDGDPAGAVDVVKKDTVGAEVQWIMGMLQTAAEQATATPAIQQGQTPDTSRSATEIAAQRTNVDKRYSFASKVLGWSERRRAKQWYACYDKFFKGGIDAKAVRIEGPLGPTYKVIKRKEFIYGTTDPDVEITSSVLSEGKRLAELQSFTNMFQLASPDPNFNKPFAMRHLFQLGGMTREQVTLLYPKTPEQLHAEQENELMLEGKHPTISVMDNHIVHIEEHNKIENDISGAHIKAHYAAMQAIKQRPDIIPAASGINPGNPSQPQPAMAGTGASPTAMPAINPNGV